MYKKILISLFLLLIGINANSQLDTKYCKNFELTIKSEVIPDMFINGYPKDSIYIVKYFTYDSYILELSKLWNETYVYNKNINGKIIKVKEITKIINKQINK